MGLREILSQTGPNQSDEVPVQVIILKYKDKIRRCTQQAEMNRVNFPKIQIHRKARFTENLIHREADSSKICSENPRKVLPDIANGMELNYLLCGY